ncbi:MAG: LPS export ABC transporter periplasmic protein LptC [Rhodospirillaceae bacterium]|nr:LPS export ABC transporter periplasmic protein LptC [Rhodospirillaceae bacterium]
MLARWGPLCILLVLVTTSAWILKELDDDQALAKTEVSHIPDFFMEHFSAVTMDENGKPMRRIAADYLVHFADTQTKELEKPYLIVYHPSRPPWHVKSDRGWVSKDDDEMLLLGQVEIWREGKSGQRVLEILTRDLRVLPEAQYGETSEQVVIRTKNSESKGVGMRAYLEERRLELLSEVVTTYEKDVP